MARTKENEAIAAQRRGHLKAIIERHFAGNSAALARAVDRSPSLLWQVLNERRQMGEHLARHIESALSLERGALDKSEAIEIDPELVEACSSDPLDGIRELRRQGRLTAVDMAELYDKARHMAKARAQ